MSSLIQFQDRAERAIDQSAGSSAKAPIVDVSAHASRVRQTPSRRRARRNWDPAFHVDLLTF